MQAVDGTCLPQAGREQAVEEVRSRPDLPAAGRRGSTRIPAGEGAQGVAQIQLAPILMTCVINLGDASVCRKAPLNQSEIPKANRKTAAPGLSRGPANTIFKSRPLKNRVMRPSLTALLT